MSPSSSLLFFGVAFLAISLQVAEAKPPNNSEFENFKANHTIQFFKGVDMGFIPIRPERITRGVVPTYYLATGQANLYDADAYCTQTGRDLLSIRDDTEQKDVEVILSRAGLVGNIWLSSFCYDGRWTWDDLTPVSSLFNKLEASNVFCDSTDGYLMMFGPYTRNPLKFQWRIENPFELNFFICKSYK